MALGACVLVDICGVTLGAGVTATTEASPSTRLATDAAAAAATVTICVLEYMRLFAVVGALVVVVLVVAAAGVVLELLVGMGAAAVEGVGEALCAMCALLGL